MNRICNRRSRWLSQDFSSCHPIPTLVRGLRLNHKCLYLVSLQFTYTQCPVNVTKDWTISTTPTTLSPNREAKATVSNIVADWCRQILFLSSQNPANLRTKSDRPASLLLRGGQADQYIWASAVNIKHNTGGRNKSGPPYFCHGGNFRIYGRCTYLDLRHDLMARRVRRTPAA